MLFSPEVVSTSVRQCKKQFVGKIELVNIRHLNIDKMVGIDIPFMRPILMVEFFDEQTPLLQFTTDFKALLMKVFSASKSNSVYNPITTWSLSQLKSILRPILLIEFLGEWTP